MAAGDWEEIKRLAADFQRAQLSTTSHKLSERNCIEIVNKLVELKLIEVIYTTDGKEYVTPQQLEREIRDELIVHGGRINLVDLQQILNLDLSHIESKVNEIVRNDHRHFTIVQGQLLDSDYLDRTAEEINETLQESGQVAVADLAKTFGLPIDFLLSVIEVKLGQQIHGQLDPVNRDVLFTPAFVARNISKIKGIFSAITRPTVIGQLVGEYGLPEKLFFSVLQTLIESRRLSGNIQGHQDKATYIPDIYSRTQTAYIDSFFDQNGYIEYHTLSKLGIFDGRQFLKKRFASKKECMFLATCCVSQSIIEQVDAAIDEAMANNSWMDVKSLVPSPFTEDDTNMLLQNLLKTSKSRSSAHVYCQRFVASEKFVKNCEEHFHGLMHAKANKAVHTSPLVFAELTKKEKTYLTGETSDGKLNKKDERNRKANAGGGQKGGAGRGGRESSTKKTKNKYRERTKGGGDDDDFSSNKQDSQKIDLSFMSIDEIFSTLQEKLQNECHEDDFIYEISQQISRPLTQKYQEVAKSIFVTSSGATSNVKKKSHQDYQEKVNGFIQNMRLFEKGANLFEGESRTTLHKYLLKTIASDVANCLFEMVAMENLMSLADDETFTNESRLKLLNKLSNEWKQPLTKLNVSLNSKDIEDFYAQLDVVLGPSFCDLMIKKLDKKKERQLMFNHRQCLMEQLNHEMAPAMVLHLAVVILFQFHTNAQLHAPGRFVPQVIAFLENKISEKDYELLDNFQKLVVKQISSKDEVPNEENSEGKSISARLSENLPSVKALVKNMKRQTDE